MDEYLHIEKSRIWFFYKVFIFLSLLASFKAWFFWNVSYNLAALLSFFIGVSMFALMPMWFEKKFRFSWLCLLFICFVFGNLEYGLPAVFSKILVGSPILFIFLLKKKYKENLLQSLQKYLFASC